MGQPKTDRTRGVVFAQKACVNSVSSPRSPIWRVIQSLDAAELTVKPHVARRLRLFRKGTAACTPYEDRNKTLPALPFAGTGAANSGISRMSLIAHQWLKIPSSIRRGIKPGICLCEPGMMCMGALSSSIS